MLPLINRILAFCSSSHSRSTRPRASSTLNPTFFTLFAAIRSRPLFIGIASYALYLRKNDILNGTF